MGETLLKFQHTVTGPNGLEYEARACGGPMPGGNWEGWIEFIPIDAGAPVRSPRETTQPNRVDTEYWATGLTPVYLEGALRRALSEPVTVVKAPPEPSVFSGPAPRPVAVDIGGESVLDPFSVYDKGEALLRRQLGALSAWHLVNIIRRYELSDEDPALLGAREPAELVEMIIAAVRAPRTVRG